MLASNRLGAEVASRTTNPKPTAEYVTPPRAKQNVHSNLDGLFTIVPSPGLDVERILRMDEYSAANAFVKGEFTVQGDLYAAIRFFLRHKRSFVRQLYFSVAAVVTELADSLLNGRNATARNIRFHYDRSNAFYRQFLDSRMLYSAACFTHSGCSLEEAQLEKLDRICRRLDLHPEERFLDVGCGWGGLVIHAAERFGARATGCSLSRDQVESARSLARDRGLDRRVTIEETDYRDLQGRFDKIASVGMFEHVGHRHLSEYFRKIHALLADRGLFLNRGIVRPQAISVGPATFFLQKSVFPGGGLAHLADVVREAELAGFQLLDMEDTRLDYALTCRAWVARLLQNAESCRPLVEDRTYRTWLLYLAASAVSFEDGVTDSVQLTFEKHPRR